MYQEEDFIKFLTYFSTREGKPLDEFTLQLYDDELSPYGYDSVCQALKNLAVSMEYPRLPSVKQIKQILEPQLDKDSEAELITGRIFESLQKFGHANTKDAIAYIGDVGWRAVVQFGGWSYFCEFCGTKTLNPGTARAQVRSLVKAHLNNYATEHHPQIEASAKFDHQSGKMVELLKGLDRLDMNKNLDPKPD